MRGYVRVDDVRQLIRLSGECREIRASGAHPVPHFLAGIAQITRAQVGILFKALLARGAPPVAEEVHDVGWASASDRDRVYSYVLANPIERDPMCRLAMSAGTETITITRSDAIGARAWADSEVRNDVHRPSGVGDSLMSVARRSPAGSARVIVLKRAFGEAAFGEDERSFLEVAHTECADLLEAPDVAKLGATWSPRERETLDLLLTGVSERAIAESLGLSPHTVHEYVKRIYRRTGVASRAELMARALEHARRTH